MARYAVRAALNSDRPPKYERAPRGSVADAYETQIRFLLNEWPRMLAPVIAERIGWPHSMSPLKKKLAQIRPEYVGIDPVDRMTYEPGEITQCDLWFPEPKVPVAPGQERILPVLVMAFGFSRFMTAVMIPSRQGGDILSGMWELISGIGRVDVLEAVWTTEPVARHEGRHHTFPAAHIGPKPLQRPRPPIYLSGFAPPPDAG